MPPRLPRPGREVGRQQCPVSTASRGTWTGALGEGGAAQPKGGRHPGRQGRGRGPVLSPDPRLLARQLACSRPARTACFACLPRPERSRADRSEERRGEGRGKRGAGNSGQRHPVPRALPCREVACSLVPRLRSATAHQLTPQANNPARNENFTNCNAHAIFDRYRTQHVFQEELRRWCRKRKTP